MGAYDQYQRLTGDEKLFLWTHPWHIDDVKEAADKALKESEKRFGRGSLHNGEGDAFRHCYWNALMARDIGKDNALEFSTAHEAFDGNPKKEKEMDLFNNAVGAEIGSKNSSESDAELANKCHNALIGGKLKVITP